MNWLTFNTSLTLIGVIELQIWVKYREEVRLELIGQIYCLTSSSGLDLVLTYYDAWSFMRFWIYVLPFNWHIVCFIWSYETPVLSRRTLNFVDAKLSHMTLISLTETESCGHLHVDITNLENILDMYLYVMMTKWTCMESTICIMNEYGVAITFGLKET